ncbi:MAG TPA: YqaA family protein [Acetobacteraceae bacterium]
MLRRFYDQVLRLAASPRAPLWLALVSFAESSFFPVPPDALLVPMALARPDRAWRLAAICTVSSVLGGMLGYLIGYAFYDAVALPLIHFYHLETKADAFVAGFQQYGLWIILIKGLTPIPYKIVTITSGLAHFDFGLFVAASAVTRGARFFIVAALLRRFGEPVREFIERRLTLVTSLTAAGIVGGVLLLRFI